ncbi:MAG: XRE family transcriptional regulator [Clostridia bacterium]|nr:XRE family transcriptional regulator [Clostridia bacterium]
MKRSIAFAENLRQYRKMLGLTQKELAQRIGYTEKSVSKWEKGDALPPTEMLVSIAELFGIGLDEMIYKKDVRHFLLGIDGGGTKTVLKLIDEQGEVKAEICKGSCNPNDIGMERAMAVLKEGIREVCHGVPLSQVTLFAGLSGGGLTGNNAKIFQDFFEGFGFFAFGNGSDVENIVGLSDYDPCVLVIMGTGFVVFTVKGDERSRVAGWGQFFDEGGSGYTLGRDAITAALEDEDGSGDRTVLTALFRERLGESASAHLAKFYQGGKRYIAQFSDMALKGAEQKDAVCLGILEKNAAFIANKIDTAIRGISSDGQEGKVPVLFSGGLCREHEILFPLIEKHMNEEKHRLILQEAEPIEGALRRARMILQNKRQGEAK